MKRICEMNGAEITIGRHDMELQKLQKQVAEMEARLKRLESAPKATVNYFGSDPNLINPGRIYPSDHKFDDRSCRCRDCRYH